MASFLQQPELYSALNILSDQKRVVRAHAAWLPFLLLRSDYTVIEYDPLLTEILGYGSEIIGASIHTILYSGLENLCLKLVSHQMHQLQEFADLEIVFKDKNEDARLLITRVFPCEYGIVLACLWPEAMHIQRRWVGDRPQFLYSLLDSMEISLAIFNAAGEYVYCNPQAIVNPRIREWIIGHTDEEYVAYRGFDPAMAARRKKHFQEAIETKAAVSFEEKIVTPTGQAVYQVRIYTPVFNPDQSLAYMIGHGMEVTELRQTQNQLTYLNDQLEARVIERTKELAALTEKLNYDAFHDSLTGLPNRAFFRQSLEEAVNQGEPYGILYLDTDRFKAINDTLGHPAGDELLCHIASRLRQEVRASDTVARMSGDEFILLIKPVCDCGELQLVASNIQQSLCQPMNIAGLEVSISVSMGIVLCAEKGQSATDVFRDADIAMYHAKAAGRDGYAIFQPQMREQAIAHNTLINDLKTALQDDQLFVLYQPIMHLETGKISGFEALVRWNHPRRGIVSPAEFIPVAEESGLLLDIDHWVLERACRDMMTWKGQPLTISVNFSARHFAGQTICQKIAETLKHTGFPAELLHVEITETALLGHREIVQKTLTKLRTMGVHLHIDDFGTGYSSLSYLHSYPLSTLKIDRSFIQKMTTRSSSAELVKTIIFMAKNMNMQVVAEGIETPEQLRQLKRLGCDYGQGYLLSRPIPIEDALEKIRNY